MAILNLKMVNCTQCIFVGDFDRGGIGGKLIMGYPFKRTNVSVQFPTLGGDEVPRVGNGYNFSEAIESMNIPTMDTENNRERLEHHNQNIILRYYFP